MANIRQQRKQPPLTVEEHIALGKQLLEGRRALMKILTRSHHNRAVRKASLALKHLDSVRCWMDSEVCGLTDRRDPRNLAVRVYYCDGSDIFRDATQAQQGDAFAGWGYSEKQRTAA